MEIKPISAFTADDVSKLKDLLDRFHTITNDVDVDSLQKYYLTLDFGHSYAAKMQYADKNRKTMNVAVNYAKVKREFDVYREHDYFFRSVPVDDVVQMFLLPIKNYSISRV